MLGPRLVRREGSARTAAGDGPRYSLPMHGGTARGVALPEIFRAWFAGRGWVAHDHQIELLAAARAGHSVLLVAPTGGGKTLAGFPQKCQKIARIQIDYPATRNG